MKIWYAPRSPFARKVRIAAFELGLTDKLTWVVTDPWIDEGLRNHNPLCKVPTLGLDDGSALYDSPVICEYLDTLAGGRLYPSGATRWQALRLQALGDGLSEAVIRRFVENVGGISAGTQAVIKRQTAAIRSALVSAERDTCVFAADPTIGEIAIAAALGYLSYRCPEEEWQRRHPRLASWFEHFSTRPSMVATKPI
jgi:glutathione S-transferase